MLTVFPGEENSGCLRSIVELKGCKIANLFICNGHIVHLFLRGISINSFLYHLLKPSLADSVYYLSLPALMAGYLNKPIKNQYMKKFLISSFLVITSFLAANAQGSIGKSDPEGKKVLDAVSAKFKTYKSVTAKFSLKI